MQSSPEKFCWNNTKKDGNKKKIWETYDHFHCFSAWDKPFQKKVLRSSV